MVSSYMPDVVVEIAFDSGYRTADVDRTWVDVSEYVENNDLIDITCGRGDERSTADANTLSLSLDNSDGRFTAGNASSPYYPNVRIGRPIRVTATPVDGTPSVRFVGYVDGWPVEWNGTDAYAKATIAASSRLARLGIASEWRSLLEEEILADDPSAYYTLGEPEGSLTAADSSGNSAPPLRQVGTGTGVVFGSATGPGTDGLTGATLAGKTFKAGTVDVSASTVGVSVSCWFTTTATDAPGLVALGHPTDNRPQIALYVDVFGYPTAYAVAPGAGGGSGVAGGTVVNDGDLHHVVGQITYGVTDSTLELFVDGLSIGTDTLTGVAGWADWPVADLQVGDAVAVGVPLVGTLSHVTVGEPLDAARVAAIYEAGVTAGEDDTPGSRLARYARLAGVPAAETDYATGITPIAQIDTAGATPVDLMRRVETTDGGVLFDAPDNTLTYLERDDRYQATPAISLSMTAQKVGAAFSPRLDRSALLNDVTATIAGGTTTARAVNAESREEYGPHTASIELATTDTDAPLSVATWTVAAFGEPSPRVPNLEVEFLTLADFEQAAVMALTIGSLIEVTAQPDQAPATEASYFVEGYTETIGPESYTFSFNVSPSSPYLDVLVVDDPARGVVDTNMIAY